MEMEFGKSVALALASVYAVSNKLDSLRVVLDTMESKQRKELKRIADLMHVHHPYFQPTIKKIVASPLLDAEGEEDAKERTVRIDLDYSGEPRAMEFLMHELWPAGDWILDAMRFVDITVCGRDGVGPGGPRIITVEF